MPSLTEIEAAARNVYAAMNPTPQYAWPLLAQRAGCEVWVKHENHTPTGAFKVRGGLNLLAQLDRARTAVPRRDQRHARQSRPEPRVRRAPPRRALPDRGAGGQLARQECRDARVRRRTRSCTAATSTKRACTRAALAQAEGLRFVGPVRAGTRRGCRLPTRSNSCARCPTSTPCSCRSAAARASAASSPRATRSVSRRRSSASSRPTRMRTRNRFASTRAIETASAVTRRRRHGGARAGAGGARDHLARRARRRRSHRCRSRGGDARLFRRHASTGRRRGRGAARGAPQDAAPRRASGWA